MDGNGRWATAKGLPRIEGHKKGADVLADTVRHAKARGIQYLTVYALSTENLNRPLDEVRGIMDLLRAYLKNVNNYRKENVRTRVLGERNTLDTDMQLAIDNVEKWSTDNSGINVNIALNYGGKDEIAHSARAAAKRLLDGEIALQQIDKTMITAGLYTAGQPDIDLLIRTGGERRISNFLLWQSAYAEFIFLDEYWPDFSSSLFDSALEEFGARERRMGGI